MFVSLVAFQDAPLDLPTNAFYMLRRPHIEQRVQLIASTVPPLCRCADGKSGLPMDSIAAATSVALSGNGEIDSVENLVCVSGV